MTTVLMSLVEVSIRATAVALLVAAVLMMARVRSSSARHVAWAAVLGAMVLMPVLSAALPALEVGWPSSLREFGAVATVQTPPSTLGLAEVAASGAAAVRGAVPPGATTSVVAPTVPFAPGLPGRAARVGPLWPSVVMAVYVAGFALLISWMVTGAMGARRILRMVEATDDCALGSVNVSSAVTVPMVVGVWKPRIVVPPTWASWSEAQRAAVVAHEQAHIARRDALVCQLAAVNCCVFWFHPLAWWLRRQLATTAEQACDEAAVRALGDRRPYAELLLDLARSVRRHRGRLNWSAIGMDGTGSLGARIERVLSAGADASLSPARATAVAIGCVAAIGVGAACRQTDAVAPLVPDPALAAQMAEEKATQAQRDAAIAMTAEEVTAHEAKVAASPEDMDSRRALITFYNAKGHRVLGWERLVAARRAQKLWVIEHHPESDLTYPIGLLPSLDPVGHQQARAIWLRHIANPPSDSFLVMYNAVTFLSMADKPEAERLLQRLIATDPDGPEPRRIKRVAYSSWVARLGQLYAMAIIGEQPYGEYGKRIIEAEARTPFARSARQTLDASSDAALLSAAGAYLTAPLGSVDGQAERARLGRLYLERAVQIDPSSSATRTLTWLKEIETANTRPSVLRDKQAEMAGEEIGRKLKANHPLTAEEQSAVPTQDEALAALSADEQLPFLPQLAASHYMGGESAEWSMARVTDEHRKKVYAAEAAHHWAMSRKYAEAGLAQSAIYRSRPELDGALWSLTLSMGANELREGRRAAAVKRLTEAADLPMHPTTVQTVANLEYRLVDYLISWGERESVINYLETSAAHDPVNADRKRADAAAIRAGKMPENYQRRMTAR